MQAYSIEIQIKGVWQLLDSSLASLVINKKVYDIGDVQGVFSAVTQTITVPFSPRNVNALQYLGAGGETLFQHLRPPVRLTVNGMEPIPNAYLADITASPLGYELIIKQGNGDFFDVLNGLTLNGLDIALQKWDMNTVESSRYNTLQPIWALVNFGFNNFTGGTADFDFIWPAITLQHVVSEIESATGYVVAGGVLSEPIYNNYIIPCLNNLASDEVRIRAEASAQMSLTVYEYTDEVQGIIFSNVISDATGLLSEAPVFGGANDSTVYEIKQTGTYNVRFVFGYSVDVFAGVDIIITIATNLGSIETEQINGTGTSTYEFWQTLTLEKGTYIGATINPQLGNSIAISQISTFEVTECNFERSAPGLFFDVAYNLPSLALTEVLKSFMLQTNSFAQANVLGGTLELIRFNEVARNADIGNVIDFTPYFVGKLSESYVFLSLAGLNWMRYAVDAGDDTVTELYDDNFTVDFLPGESDYIQLPYSGSGAVIPAQRLNDDMEIEIDIMNARCLQLAYSDVPITYELTGYMDSVVATNVPYTTFAPLTWQTLKNAYHSEYIDAITTPQIFTCLFDLPIVRFADFQFNNPIFVAQLGAYFQVLEFENFTANEPVRINMLKIS